MSNYGDNNTRREQPTSVGNESRKFNQGRVIILHRPGSGQTLHYRGVTLLHNFTTALLYMSLTAAIIVAMLLNIY